MKNTIDRLDAVNKAYADRIKYKSASGNISNAVLTDHILFTSPTRKDFASGMIKISEMWVEWLADELVATSSPMFQKCSKGPSLMTFFSGSPASGWTENFRLDYIELP